jgi:HAD superfamily hydrolase (TIGR01509 family)
MKNSSIKTILVDAVDCFVSDTGEVFEQMHQLLDSYPQPKILLTGADNQQFKKFGLDKMPYEVFTLKHNPEKTDPLYFKTLLADFTLEASEVLYFEHNPQAVHSAESIGIKSYHFDESKKDLKSLRGFLDSYLHV